MSLRKFNPNSIADQSAALRWETARADLLLKLGHLHRAAEASMKAQGHQSVLFALQRAESGGSEAGGAWADVA